MTNELDLQILHAYFQSFDYNFSRIRQSMKLSKHSNYLIRKMKKQFIQLSELKKNTNYKELFQPLLNKQPELTTETN